MNYVSERRKERNCMFKAKYSRKSTATLVLAVLLYGLLVLNIPIGHSCYSTLDKLDIEANVGSIHFRGEVAEFFILVSHLGTPIDAEISATLYYNGTLHANLTSLAEHVATGLYRVPYTVPTDASTGNYALVVNARTCQLKGVTLVSFLLSSTLTNWNAWIIDIQGDLATIKTDVGIIKASLEAIDARLISIDGRIATLETDLGAIRVDIDNINLRLTHIEGDLATITTALGTINGTLISIQGDIAIVKTDIGLIQTDISAINATLKSINSSIVTIQTNIGEIKISLNQINATLVALNETIATIKTDIGTIMTSIEDIQLKISKINGSIATITTTLGDINGTLVSIEGDIANIKTMLGDIKASLPSPQTTELGIPIAAVFAVIAAISSSVAAGLLVRRRSH
jgi:predicted  nucleic acid-binding Zn-ribbon protein